MIAFDSVFRSGLFAGRTVLVTGGGTGIGRCTAHELASLGAQLVIAGRRAEVLEATVEEIRENGGLCDSVVMDVRDDDSVEAGVAQVARRFGRLDALFNNAGGQFAAPAESISNSAWRKVVDLNLHGMHRVTMAAYRNSMGKHGGAIVSMLADIHTGYSAMAHSAAARAGIENFTKTLALEWSKYDIRINCVAPGTILSSGMRTYPEPVQKIAADGRKTVPSARLGTESEVSAAVVFLLSPAAAFINGQTLCIDGASSLQKGRILPVAEHAPTRSWNGFHLSEDWTGTPFEEFEPE